MTQEEHYKFFEEQSAQGHALNWGEIDSILADWREERDDLLEHIATLNKIIYTLNGVANFHRVSQQAVDLAIKNLMDNVMGDDLLNAGEITKGIIERLDPQYGGKK